MSPPLLGHRPRPNPDPRLPPIHRHAARPDAGYFDLAEQGAGAAPELIALLEDQQVALQERLEQLQRHVAYVKHKIAYWRAVEADDAQAANIGRRLAGQILADAQCPPATPVG